jgi:prepilin-type N-terminal cleavage/methylation domain-containing protein
MGLGDVKFAIFPGLILGIEKGMYWLFVSFLTGAVVASILLLSKKAKLKQKIAFGPFLIISFVIVYNMVKKLSNGFTLIELIIVVTLISFLALLAISYFRNQIFKAQDAKRKSDIKTIQIAVEEYEKDHNCYPTPEMMDCTPGTGLMPYLNKIPCDPITNESYYYNYQVDDCPSWYRLYTVLENESDDDIVTNCG